MSENNNERPAFEPMKAIGAFLAVFGFATMGAAFLDMPTYDKIVNIVCGLVIVASGAGLFAVGLKRTRKE